MKRAVFRVRARRSRIVLVLSKPMTNACVYGKLLQIARLRLLASVRAVWLRQDANGNQRYALVARVHVEVIVVTAPWREGGCL